MGFGNDSNNTEETRDTPISELTRQLEKSLDDLGYAVDGLAQFLSPYIKVESSGSTVGDSEQKKGYYSALYNKVSYQIDRIESTTAQLNKLKHSLEL